VQYTKSEAFILVAQTHPCYSEPSGPGSQRVN